MVDVLPSGLSPRVRGNRVQNGFALQAARSIPARAGEPSCATGTSAWNGVYPRACGGTATNAQANAVQAGLSPRVRGNPHQFWWAALLGRSIPARAGEPQHVAELTVPVRVYPRACGGTAVVRGADKNAYGLSPRVRGNRVHPRQHDSVGRSIPARAGEPAIPGSAPAGGTVYPRACGGTRLRRLYPVRYGGLSPRVRGNHQLEGEAAVSFRSIPARAGEPALG